jgi:hypothetical protein
VPQPARHFSYKKKKEKKKKKKELDALLSTISQQMSK